MKKSIVPDSAPGEGSSNMLIVPSSAAAAAYTFLRHTGFILDELSAQGLVLWLDNDERWRWQGTDLESERGF